MYPARPPRPAKLAACTHRHGGTVATRGPPGRLYPVAQSRCHHRADSEAGCTRAQWPSATHRDTHRDGQMGGSLSGRAPASDSESEPQPAAHWHWPRQTLSAPPTGAVRGRRKRKAKLDIEIKNRRSPRLSAPPEQPMDTEVDAAPAGAGAIEDPVGNQLPSSPSPLKGVVLRNHFTKWPRAATGTW